MDEDGDDKDDSKRRTRNLSEKKRRDQFNMLVNELSSMITTNNRKMDKSTVLKSAIAFLKNHNEVTVRARAHDVQEDWKPSFLANEEFTYLVLEAIEGFILVFSGNGKINYVSEGIMSLLGQNPADVLNSSIYDLIPDVDHQHIYNILHQSRTIDPMQYMNDSDNEIRFQCHLKRGTLDFRNEATYELVDFIGRVRTNIEPLDGEDVQSYQHDHDSRLLLVCTGRLHTPQLIRDESLVDSSRSEFTSRHSLEWKFLFLDHRAPPIIGYLPFEVLGTSGYDYYHFDDLEKVITCHEILMQKGELTSCYYRFLTKGQQWIWLQTRFYITYHQWNSKPEFVVCTHRVVSYNDMAKGTKVETLDEEVTSELDNSNSQRSNVELRPDDSTHSQASPNYYSDNNDSYTSYRKPKSQSASVKSTSQSSNAATVVTLMTGATPGAVAAAPQALDPGGGAWGEPRRYAGSDCASVSGDSRSSQRDGMRDLSQSIKSLGHESTTPPVHGMRAQYLEPLPYVSVVGATPVLPAAVMPPLPVIVSHDHAQAQEQLQRKHEQLQQMIMRQQEELRQVKEQLLLARLGMLQPILPQASSAYGTLDEGLSPTTRLPMVAVIDHPPLPTAAYPPPPPLPPPPQPQPQPPPRPPAQQHTHHIINHHLPHMPQ